MGFVDGWSPMDLKGGPWPEHFETDHAARKGLAYELVDGIARLSKVDCPARGLAHLGRPARYHDRPVAPRTTILERHTRRRIPGPAEAAAMLPGHQTLGTVPALVHA